MILNLIQFNCCILGIVLNYPKFHQLNEHLMHQLDHPVDCFNVFKFHYNKILKNHNKTYRLSNIGIANKAKYADNIPTRTEIYDGNKQHPAFIATKRKYKQNC